jgi:uncharacterized delta-60 repeat protein
MKKLLVVLLSFGIVNSVLSAGPARASDEGAAVGVANSEYHSVRGSDGAVAFFPKGVSPTLDAMASFLASDQDGTIYLRDFKASNFDYVNDIVDRPGVFLSSLQEKLQHLEEEAGEELVKELAELLVFLDLEIPANLTRYLDTDFAVNGIYAPGIDDSIQAIQVQKNGKILLAGSHDSGSHDYRWYMERLNSDGSLDQTFASNGIYASDIDGSIKAMQVQEDGKILLVGYYDRYRWYVERLNSDGSVDQTFARGGIYVPDDDRSIYLMQMQPDGKKLIASNRGYVQRLNSDGSVDQTFAENGICASDYFDMISTMLVQEDGKILVSIHGNADSRSYVKRLNPDGSVDGTFAEDGIYPSNTLGMISVMKVQKDGKIIIGKSKGIRGGGRGSVQRLKPDGSVDKTFAEDGIYTPEGLRTINAMQIQEDGKILLVGRNYQQSYVQRLANDFGTIAEKRRYWIRKLQRRAGRE